MFPQSKVISLICAVFFMVCALGLIKPAAAQRGSMPSDSGDAGTGGNYAIVGNVYFPSGQRVDTRIRVRLYTMTRGDMTTMTDDNGSFAFRRLAPGTYTVVIDAEKDYEPVREDVRIIQPMRSLSSTEQIIPVQIRLQPRNSSEYKPGVLNSDLAGVPKRALSFYNKALGLAKDGDSRSAIEQFQRAISEYPNFTLAINELGVQYLQLGELEKAEESFRSALKISPDAFAPLMNHGIALVRLNRFKEAEPELRRALKQKEQSAIGHYYLGRALANLRRLEEAEQELLSALKLGGDQMKEAHRYLAAIYSERGDNDRVIIEVETYLRLQPHAADAQQLRQLVQKLRESKITRP